MLCSASYYLEWRDEFSWYIIGSNTTVAELPEANEELFQTNTSKICNIGMESE